MYILRNIYSRNHSIELIGAIIIFLLIITSWIFKVDVYNNSMLVEKSLVCAELDENRQPVKVSEDLPYGTRQVCLWMKYKSPRVPRELNIQWKYNNKIVLIENQQILNTEGIKAFYFLREDGAPLPPGRYRVIVSDGAKVMNQNTFSIKRTK